MLHNLCDKSIYIVYLDGGDCAKEILIGLKIQMLNWCLVFWICLIVSNVLKDLNINLTSTM